MAFFDITAANKFSAAFKEAHGELSKTQSVLGGVAAAAAALGSINVFKNLIGESFKMIDAVAKTSDKLNVATEALTGLQHAASLADVSNEALEKNLIKMTRAVSEAAKGTGSAKEAIKELGLSAADLVNMRADEQMMVFADALAQVKNPADRTRLSLEVFGKSAADLIPLIKDGSGAIREQIEEAQQLGVVYSRVDAAKIEGANDQFTRLQAVVTGAANSFAVAFAPQAEAFLKWLTDSASEGGRARSMMADFGETSGRMLGLVADSTVGVQLAWLQLEKVVNSVVGVVTLASSGMATVLSKVTFGDVSKEFAASAEELTDMAVALDQEAESYTARIAALENSPLPSVKIMAALEGIQARVAEAGKKVGEGFGASLSNGVVKKVKEINLDSVYSALAGDEEKIAREFDKRRELIAEAFNKHQITSEEFQRLSKDSYALYVDDLQKLDRKRTADIQKEGQAQLEAQLQSLSDRNAVLAAEQESANVPGLAEDLGFDFGGSDKFEAELEAQRSQEQEKLAILDESHQLGLISEQYYQDQRQQIVNAYALQTAEIQRRQNEKIRQDQSTSLKNARDGFVAFLEMAGKHNRSAFNALKAVRITEAIVNTYAGANMALASLPFPANVAAAAAVIAGGLANVATIQSASFGGGGGGGGGGSGNAGAASLAGQVPGGRGVPELPAQEQVAPQRSVVTINLGDEDDLISKSSVRRIINRIQEEHSDGAIIRVS